MGQSPELSRELVVAAAIALVDEVGLERFSVREIARRLEVFPTAVYWHVGSRSRLLSLAAGKLIAQVDTEREPSPDWRAELTELAHGIREVMHRHPNFASIFGAEIGVDITPSIPLVEVILRALKRAPVPNELTIPLYNAYTGGVIGWVSMELAKTSASTGRDMNWQAKVASDLASLDPDSYPNARRLTTELANRAFMTRWTSGIDNPLDSSFATLLRVLIGGIEQEIARPVRTG